MEQEMLVALIEIKEIVESLETIISDLMNYLGFVYPLMIGILIGLIAMKTFWESASRW